MPYTTTQLNNNSYQIDITINDVTQTFYHALSEGETIEEVASVAEQRLLGTYVSPINEDDYIAKTQYAQQRASEYPSIKDQLDLLYHEGYEGWKAAIQTVKEKYPKPTNSNN